MADANTYREAIQSPPTPYRGPSAYQSRSQYYEVLNKFFSAGQRVRRFARFKRIGDKRGWGPPEWKEGLELDRSRFLYEWKLSQVAARLSECSADGCEIVSYKKHPAPGGMVTYLLVSWPTNAELERNRAKRTAAKQPKQKFLPRSVTPFQHPQPRITAESPAPSVEIKPGEDWFTKTTGRERPASHPFAQPFSPRRMAQADCRQVQAPTLFDTAARP